MNKFRKKAIIDICREANEISKIFPIESFRDITFKLILERELDNFYTEEDMMRMMEAEIAEQKFLEEEANKGPDWVEAIKEKEKRKNVKLKKKKG